MSAEIVAAKRRRLREAAARARDRVIAMPPTEIILTKLLGYGPRDGRDYPSSTFLHLPVPPDFNTLDGCREFENEIRVRGLNDRYRERLSEIVAEPNRYIAESLIYASAEQRRAACLIVIKEAGL